MKYYRGMSSEEISKEIERHKCEMLGIEYKPNPQQKKTYKKYLSFENYDSLTEEELNQEQWRVINGYDGKYQMSNYGRVKNMDYRGTGKEKIVPVQIGPKNMNYFQYVALTYQGKSNSVSLYSLFKDTWPELI